MSQKVKIMSLLAGGATMSIEALQKGTGILRPNIRRILGQGALKGEFTRVDRGVYTLTTADGKVNAYIEASEAQTALPRLVAKGLKLNMVFLDPAYFSKALEGGNRGIKDYTFISPAEFGEVMISVAKLVSTPQSHVYLMLSGARTAQADMQKYLDQVYAAGFKLVKEGKYTKRFGNGKHVTNVRGEVAQPEKLFLFTLSGELMAGEEPVEMDFLFERPNGRYQTEKAAGFINMLIKQATCVGDTVGDFFGGSGVTGEQSIITRRSVVIIEKSLQVVNQLIYPRVRRAIAAYNSMWCD